MTTQRIAAFDTYRPGYGGAVVSVFIAGTTSLASIYEDEALTIAAANPVTLSSLVMDDIDYGKWPINGSYYTAQTIELRIATDETGVIRPPLVSLDGEDASDATVAIEGQSTSHSLAEVLARFVFAEDYGALSETDSASNTTTLAAAIGAAAGVGGGVVLLPAGNIPFTTLSIPAGVVLQGLGRGVTVLQSQTAGKCITLAGDRAGFTCLSVDGVNVVPLSTGVYAKAKNETVFRDAEIKRFATGLHFKGGRRADWRDLFISTCTNGAKLHGDLDSGGGSDGDQFIDNLWTGGKVEFCSGIGVDLSYEDKRCWHNEIRAVGFENNTGTALRVNGARYAALPGCWFEGNTTDFAVQDDDAATTAARAENTVVSLTFDKTRFRGGAATLRDTCQDIVFQSCEISDVDFTFTTVSNAILARDCIEDSSVTFAGDTTKWTRWQSIARGVSSGLTTDNNATKAWSITLNPGDVAILEAKVVGNQRNGTKKHAHHIEVAASRAGSALAYDTQTANFTVGQIVTGGTSGATGRIVADSDSGATGTLTVRDIAGAFVVGETLTDPAGGSARCSAALVAANAALDGTGVSELRAVPSGYSYTSTFAANGFDVELRVTGASSETVEWLCDVEATV